MTPDNAFDVIVVGARVAGCTAAYQFALRGWRVALVEKHSLPLGPVLSLPITYARGQERFRSLGLAPVLEAMAPDLKHIRSLRLRLDDELVLEGRLPAAASGDYALILPRERLDNALLSYVLAQPHAAPGGITLFAGHRVDQLVRQGGARGPVIGVHLADGPAGDTASGHELYAPLVVGADGRLSRVAALLGPEARRYRVEEPTTSLAYCFCRGAETSGLADVFFAPAHQSRMVVLTEIDARLQVIGVYMPSEQYAAFRGQGVRDTHYAEHELRATWESVPELAGRMDRVELLGKVLGLDPRAGAGFFRPAGGSGWALVGDAAHFKDPASGQGIHDALYTVGELIATLDHLVGGRPLSAGDATRRWPRAARRLQRRRDRALLGMYNFTNKLSELLTHPPSRYEYALLRCIAEDPDAMRAFLGVTSGTTDVATFKRALPSYLLHRLAGHGVDLARLARDVAYLFHRPWRASVVAGQGQSAGIAGIAGIAGSADDVRQAAPAQYPKPG